MNTLEWKNDYEFLDELQYGDEWTPCTEEVMDRSRWSLTYTQVFQRKEDGSYWDFSWSVGATEYQEVDLDLTCVEVYPEEVKTTVYKVKRGEGKHGKNSGGKSGK